MYFNYSHKAHKNNVKPTLLYYAFGSAIQELSYSSDTSNKYRFGFIGEELMYELADEGMAYDLGARFYDARLGRMFSLDPLMSKYPWQSPYAYCYNSPVGIVDIKGIGGPYVDIESNGDNNGGENKTNLNPNNGVEVFTPYWKLNGKRNLVIYIYDGTEVSKENMDKESRKFDYIVCNNFEEAKYKLKNKSTYNCKKNQINNLIIRTHITNGIYKNKAIHSIDDHSGSAPCLHDKNNATVKVLTYIFSLCSEKAKILFTVRSIVQRNVESKSYEATYAAKHLSNIFLKNTNRKLYLNSTVTHARKNLKFSSEIEGNLIYVIESFNFDFGLSEANWNAFIQYSWDFSKNKRKRTKNNYNLKVNSSTGAIDDLKLEMINQYDS